MRIYILLLSTMGLGLACGKKSSKSTTAPEAEAARTEVAGLAISPLLLAQKVESSTPDGFKSGTSLARIDAEAACGAVWGGSGDSRPDGYYACKAAYEVRERFFIGGPTFIQNRLDSVDERLNTYVGWLGQYEVPCFNPEHTEEKTAVVLTGADSSNEQTVPAYALKSFADKTIFSDGHSLDFGRNYYFSCEDKFGDTADFRILLGQNEGTWYLGEFQMYNASTSAENAGRMRTLMSLDQNDNMEVFLAVGNKALVEDTATNPETGRTASTLKNGIYKTSTGLAQFVVRPQEGIIGAAALFDTGCEQRLIMNDTAVYVEINANNYGVCYANDIWTTDSSYQGPSHSAARKAIKTCLRVSGSVPEPLTDLELCEKSGLIVSDDNGGYLDPFAKYGILKFNSDLSNPPTGGHAFRAYHAARIWPEVGDGVNQMQRVMLPDNSTLVYEDKSSFTTPFAKASDGTDADSSTVTAACNASSADKEKSFSQKWELPVSQYLSSFKSFMQQGATTQYTEEEINAKILTALQESFESEGDDAPVVRGKVNRTTGATFRGVGTGTYTLKYGSSTIGTATLDQTSLSNTEGQSEISFKLSDVPTLAADGKFTLEFSGKTTLNCNTETSTTRKVNVQLGMMQMQIPFVPIVLE